ncbi:MAG: preprotein translocase subunit SecG [Leptospirales bacterium]|nr:preprotein translocase subunit SecG [Leptospirales bacterium]
MAIVQTLILVVFFICCTGLIFLILIQSGKGGSMGIMGGGGSGTAFGSSTIDVVEKVAFWFAIAFFVLAILAAVAFADAGPKVPTAEEEQKTDTQAQPGTGNPANPGVPAVPGAPANAPAQP